MFAEITAVADGVIEEEWVTFDETMLTHDLTYWEEEAEACGVTVEIYRLDHDHDPGIECECAQYSTDHHAYRTYNG